MSTLELQLVANIPVVEFCSRRKSVVVLLEATQLVFSEYQAEVKIADFWNFQVSFCIFFFVQLMCIMDAFWTSCTRFAPPLLTSSRSMDCFDSDGAAQSRLAYHFGLFWCFLAFPLSASHFTLPPALWVLCCPPVPLTHNTALNFLILTRLLICSYFLPSVVSPSRPTPEG